MRILHVGDVMGKPGRSAFEALLPQLKAEFKPDFIVVNGENTAGGRGINPRFAEWYFSLGVDVITSGNHIWDQKEIGEYLDSEPRLLRPANYAPAAPGSGLAVVRKGDLALAVISLQGRVFMPPIDCPFQTVDRLLEQVQGLPVLVDFHAEATSEKKMMAHWLDGRVMALLGTHTHVPTADEMLLPKGTAYQTDVGMTGSRHSSIGATFESALPKTVYQMPSKLEVSDQDVWFNGTVVYGDADWGLATAVFRVQRPYQP